MEMDRVNYTPNHGEKTKILLQSQFNLESPKKNGKNQLLGYNNGFRRLLVKANPVEEFDLSNIVLEPAVLSSLEKQKQIVRIYDPESTMKPIFKEKDKKNNKDDIKIARKLKNRSSPYYETPIKEQIKLKESQNTRRVLTLIKPSSKSLEKIANQYDQEQTSNKIRKHYGSSDVNQKSLKSIQEDQGSYMGSKDEVKEKEEQKMVYSEKKFRKNRFYKNSDISININDADIRIKSSSPPVDLKSRKDIRNYKSGNKHSQLTKSKVIFSPDALNRLKNYSDSQTNILKHIPAQETSSLTPAKLKPQSALAGRSPEHISMFEIWKNNSTRTETSPFELHEKTMLYYIEKMAKINFSPIPTPENINQATYYMVELRNIYFTGKKTEEAMIYRKHFEETFNMIKRIHQYKIIKPNLNIQKGVEVNLMEVLGNTAESNTSRNNLRTNKGEKIYQNLVASLKKIKNASNNQNMSSLERDRILEEQYNGGNSKTLARRKIDQIKEFEGIGDHDRYLVIDIDETMVFTEFLTRESDDWGCVYLELQPGIKYKVTFYFLYLAN